MSGARFVDILGTAYEIIEKPYRADELFEMLDVGGYCDKLLREIVVCDVRSLMSCGCRPQEACIKRQKAMLRMGILQAFLHESGLGLGIRLDTGEPESSWTQNMAMLEWATVQGTKIYKAWEDAGAL